MSTPCFLLHIGHRWIASANGVKELELRLKAIDREIGWLKELSKQYKNGASYGAVAIGIQAMRYVKHLNPPRVNPEIFELWCRTFNFDVMTILYREERPADDKFGFPDVFPDMFPARGFLKSGCQTYEEFCTKALVKIDEGQTIEVPEDSPWNPWAEARNKRWASRYWLGGYSELAKGTGHDK